jgi:hypothetical protein
MIVEMCLSFFGCKCIKSNGGSQDGKKKSFNSAFRKIG